MLLNRAIKPLYNESYVGGRACLRYNFIDLNTNELLPLSEINLHEVYILNRGKKIIVDDVQWNYAEKTIAVHFTGKKDLYELLDRRSGLVKINVVFSYKGHEDKVFTYKKTYKFIVEAQFEKWRKQMGLPKLKKDEKLVIFPVQIDLKPEPEPEEPNELGLDSNGEVVDWDKYYNFLATNFVHR